MEGERAWGNRLKEEWRQCRIAKCVATREAKGDRDGA